MMKIMKNKIYNHDDLDILWFNNHPGDLKQVKYALQNECYFEAVAVLGVLIENVLRIHLSGELVRTGKIKGTNKAELPKEFIKKRLRFVDLNRKCDSLSLISKGLFHRLETFRDNRNKMIHSDPYREYTVGFAKNIISEGEKIVDELLKE